MFNAGEYPQPEQLHKTFTTSPISFIKSTGTLFPTPFLSFYVLSSSFW
jgi:hypothetical protein